jgi:hypothetical protein
MLAISFKINFFTLKRSKNTYSAYTRPKREVKRSTVQGDIWLIILTLGCVPDGCLHFWLVISNSGPARHENGKHMYFIFRSLPYYSHEDTGTWTITNCF